MTKATYLFTSARVPHPLVFPRGTQVITALCAPQHAKVTARSTKLHPAVKTFTRMEVANTNCFLKLVPRPLLRRAQAPSRICSNYLRQLLLRVPRRHTVGHQPLSYHPLRGLPCCGSKSCSPHDVHVYFVFNTPFCLKSCVAVCGRAPSPYHIPYMYHNV